MISTQTILPSRKGSRNDENPGSVLLCYFHEPKLSTPYLHKHGSFNYSNRTVLTNVYHPEIFCFAGSLTFHFAMTVFFSELSRNRHHSSEPEWYPQNVNQLFGIGFAFWPFFRCASSSPSVHATRKIENAWYIHTPIVSSPPKLPAPTALSRLAGGVISVFSRNHSHLILPPIPPRHMCLHLI